MQEARDNDPRRQEFRDRLRVLITAFGAGADKQVGGARKYEFTAADVYNKALEQTNGPHNAAVLRYPELTEAFGGKYLSAKSIGNQLAKDLDRVVKGLVKESDKGHRYRVMGEKEIPSKDMKEADEAM